jgi:hypothetical protein
MDVLGIVAYIGVGLLVTLIGLTIHNVVQYLIRQKRWTVIPVLIFYVTAFFDLCYRIYTILWVIDGRYFFAVYFPMVCKLIIGYTQFWTILELNIRVRQCIFALETSNDDIRSP